MSLSHFTFLGTTYEQGLAHGEILKESIINNIEIYVNLFENEAGIGKNELLENSGIYLNILREQSPEYVNGMNGVAESSNLKLLEIAMLNLRYEMLYFALGKRYLEDAVDGCTSFALMPETTDNNHLMMGQNWDWIPEIECILTTSTDTDGLKRMAFTEAGMNWLARDLGVPKRDITNINIKGRLEIKLRDGREETRSLKAFGEFARPACLYCMDYAADNADIGLGGIGLNGWTFTVIRTEAGHRAWQALLEAGWVEVKELDEVPKSKELLVRLSRYKRNRPLPALMPTHLEREAIGNLDPKHYYRGWEDGCSAKDWRPLPPPPKKKKAKSKSGESAP